MSAIQDTEGTRFQFAGGEKILGFFAAGEDDDERARLGGVGGRVIDDERDRERRVGAGSFVERVIGKETTDRSKIHEEAL